MSTTLDAPETAPPPSAAELEPPGQVKRLWPALALPGTLWIVLLFAVPFYAIAAIAFGGTDPIFGSPTPEWNPYYWDTTTFVDTLNQVFNGPLRDVFVRTGVYVLLSPGAVHRHRLPGGLLHRAATAADAADCCSR